MVANEEAPSVGLREPDGDELAMAADVVEFFRQIRSLVWSMPIEDLCHPQERAARPGVELDLSVGRTLWFARHDLDQRARAASTHGQPRRANARISEVSKALLDDPVLERVERDEGGEAADLDHAGDLLDGSLEVSEFVIERDPERLKNKRRRIDRLLPSRFTPDVVHDLGERCSIREPALVASVEDDTRESTGVLELAIPIEDPGELAMSEPGEQLFERLAVRTHPHIERPTFPEGEPT